MLVLIGLVITGSASGASVRRIVLFGLFGLVGRRAKRAPQSLGGVAHPTLDILPGQLRRCRGDGPPLLRRRLRGDLYQVTLEPVDPVGQSVLLVGHPPP